MDGKREDELWERLYNMDGFGLSDYMNQLYPFTDPLNKWATSQHGHDLFVVERGAFTFSWNRFDLWRENVSYYFNGFIDCIEGEGEERFCEVAVYYLASVLFSREIERLRDMIQPVEIGYRLLLF